MLENIISLSSDYFLRYGIRNVSMDDIAQALGISKKTLYLHVDNKETLVHMVAEKFMCEDEQFALKIKAQNLNAIDEMLQIAENVYLKLKNINVASLYDLHKYYPQVWNMFEQHRHSFIAAIIQENLSKGIAEGLYRQNLPPKIYTHFYLTLAGSITDMKKGTCEKCKPAELFMEFFKYHILGISSDKGIQYLKKNLDKIKAITHETIV